MTEGWIVEAEETYAEDVREAGVDLGVMRERTASEIGAWQELGRGLASRFLAVARGELQQAERADSDDSSAAAGSARRQGQISLRRHDDAC